MEKSLLLEIKTLDYTAHWLRIWNQPIHLINWEIRDFPGGPVVKNPPYNEGDMGSIPG